MSTPGPGRAAREGALADVEDWFLGRGVPHLIALKATPTALSDDGVSEIATR